MSNKNKAKYAWEIPGHHDYKRGKNWYVIAGIIVFIMIFFSFFTIQHWKLIFLGANSNFLFSLIIIISVIIMIIQNNDKTATIPVSVDDNNIQVGNKIYPYDKIKHFSIVYKPDEDIKNLYLEFKNQLHFRLSIPLLDINVLKIREFLLKNLDEDIERTEQPLSEQLTKILKL